MPPINVGCHERAGKLPADDDWIEDRVLVCLLVAWGELAAMKDNQRRDEIVGSLTILGKRVVGKVLAAKDQMAARAESTGQSVVDILLEAVREGTAEAFPLPKGETSRPPWNR